MRPPTRDLRCAPNVPGAGSLQDSMLETRRRYARHDETPGSAPGTPRPAPFRERRTRGMGRRGRTTRAAATPGLPGAPSTLVTGMAAARTSTREWQLLRDRSVGQA